MESEQRVERLFEQLAQLRESGYELASADVKTAAELVVDDPNVELRDYFAKDGAAGQAVARYPVAGSIRRVRTRRNIST